MSFHRDLPWRRERDPYRILVSEMMLVQTTVAAVIPYFERFLARFPDPQTLASAPETEVLKAWEGLGYYRRARHLQAAARVIVERYQGKFPSDPRSVRDLPGVGRYMAGAILSFAFDLPEPIVEANSQRVLARLLAWRGDLKASSSQARLWEAAARLVPPQGAGKFNQALMDLGALICTPRSPKLSALPPGRSVRGPAAGASGRDPRDDPQAAPPGRVRGLRGRRARRPGADGAAGRRGVVGGVLGVPHHPLGRWRPRRPSLRPACQPGRGGRAAWPEFAWRRAESSRRLTYSVTKYRVELRAYLARALSGRPRPGPGFDRRQVGRARPC